MTSEKNEASNRAEEMTACDLSIEDEKAIARDKKIICACIVTSIVVSVASAIFSFFSILSNNPVHPMDPPITSTGGEQ